MGLTGASVLSPAAAARLEGLVALSEPGVSRPREQLAWQFGQQARACLLAGSPLYAELLLRAAEDLEAEGVAWRLVSEHVAPGRGRAIALRFLNAVHCLVLTGRAPTLERFFAATCGADPHTDAWPAVRAVLEEQESALAPLVGLPCQTNEPGRSASLILGLLSVAARSGLPVHLIEIGCAAGLNLRLDRFHYSGDGQEWGDPTSAVDLEGFWVDVGPVPVAELVVASRTGVDPEPIDVTTEEGRLTVTSSVWGDQPRRLELLAGAIGIAHQVPVTMVVAGGVEWLEQHLRPAAGHVTVVMQSVVREYLGDEGEGRLDAAMAAAGALATPASPIAWIELEPITLTRRHGLRITMWPGGEQISPVTAAPLGFDVRRSDADPSV